jgi:hypothetical protein
MKNYKNHAGENFIVNFLKGVPGNTIFKLMKKVRTDNILIGRRPLERNHVVTKEKFDDISRN